ncbi:hypothetical protein [Neptuniibacter sp. QD37_11]|uniref:hypothetical protein n=1 Tax=Neptuniibacter sp. QD37_11 TaxID=3398209 RepID=UPI0039F4DBE8
MGSMKRSPKKKGRFVGIPYHVAKSLPFAQLKAAEVKLLVDLLCQCNGRNNGCLSACHALMKERGWASSSLHRAFSGLISKGFLVVTRQGWKQRGRPTLVAITWNGIDEPVKGVQYDDGISPGNIPLGYWCKSPSSWK